METESRDWLVDSKALRSFDSSRDNQVVGPPGALSVIGRDDRRAVPDIRQRPTKWICQILTYKSKSAKTRRGFGSGFLIGRRTILTAGHNLWLDGKRAGYFEVFFGSEGDRNQSIYGGYAVTKSFPHTHFDIKTRSRFDVAALVLERPIDEGILTGFGFLNWLPVRAGQLRGSGAMVSGYPLTVPKQTPKPSDDNATQYFHLEEVTDHKNGFAYYPIDTTVGQSGSPLIVCTENALRQQTSVAVGIHVHAATATEPNAAVAIEPSIETFIREQLAIHEQSEFA